MMDEQSTQPAIEGDRPVAISAHTTVLLSDAYRSYSRHAFEMADRNDTPAKFEREVLHVGPVVGVLAVDLGRGEIVLIRQFRMPAHLASGRGELVELAAGRVDAGEEPRIAALRELHEETGLVAKRAVHVLTFMPAAAFADEVMTLWIADVDATNLPDVAGLEDEGETIRPFRLSIDDALAAVARNIWRSAPLVIALLWLQANRDRLDAVFIEPS